MGSFLLFTGVLAMILGSLAVIEGQLGCFSHMRRKHGVHWSGRRAEGAHRR